MRWRLVLVHAAMPLLGWFCLCRPSILYNLISVTAMVWPGILANMPKMDASSTPAFTSIQHAADRSSRPEHVRRANGRRSPPCLLRWS
eukprot:11147687-Alexandrium_andersonii.AAC.1